MRPRRFHRLRSVLSRRQPDLTVLMEKVNKPHNFSAILRNCDAVGVLEAHVVPPRHGLDLHHGTSAGTKKWIQVHTHETVEDGVAHLKERGFTVVAAHPSDDAMDYRAVDYTRPIALMMGAELYGVSDEGLALADAHVVVPMVGMVHSLNVSVATALLLFEAFRQRDAEGLYDEPRLEPGRFRKTLFEWAYPTLARTHRDEGRDYPVLDDDGQIVLPAGDPSTSE